MDKNKKDKIGWKELLVLTIIWIVLFSSIIVGIGYLVAFLAIPAYDLLVKNIGKALSNVTGVLIVLAAGVLLFSFREAYRTQYGLLEISFGLVSAWFGVYKFESAGYVEVITLIASVYLVVRGIDNYQLGRGKLLKGGNRRLTFK